MLCGQGKKSKNVAQARLAVSIDFLQLSSRVRFLAVLDYYAPQLFLQIHEQIHEHY